MSLKTNKIEEFLMKGIKKSRKENMKSILNLVSYIVVSLLVVIYCAYVQIQSTYNMSIVYVYCFYNIIMEIKKWHGQKNSSTRV